MLELPQPEAELEHTPTAREIEVLQLVSEGLANREIGDRLYLSEETVKSHVRHLLAKLRARSRAHAVAVGFRRGLLSLNEPGRSSAAYAQCHVQGDLVSSGTRLPAYQPIAPPATAPRDTKRTIFRISLLPSQLWVLTARGSIAQ